jgi:O-methyltransferase
MWGEYRRAVSALNFDVFDSGRPIHLHDLNPEEREVYVDVTDIAAQTPESIAQLRRCMEYILTNQIPGDFVECGVYKGAGPYVITKILRESGVLNRRVWLYDTFEGMPEVDQQVDLHVNPRRQGDHAYEEWSRTRISPDSQASNFMRSPIEVTKDYVLRSGYPEENLEFVKGGVIIIDDYGAFAGARKAVDEYFAGIGEAICLFRIDEHVRAGIKMKYL